MKYSIWTKVGIYLNQTREIKIRQTCGWGVCWTASSSQLKHWRKRWTTVTVVYWSENVQKLVYIENAFNFLTIFFCFGIWNWRVVCLHFPPFTVYFIGTFILFLLYNLLDLLFHGKALISKVGSCVLPSLEVLLTSYM